VIVDAPGLYEIPALGLTYDRLSGFVEAIESDPRFTRVVAEPVSALGATVTIWQRQKE
jgi:hypothetical protein